jgi:outer membrane protein OmpA-like peptidoglycan-associated protein
LNVCAPAVLAIICLINGNSPALAQSTQTETTSADSDSVFVEARPITKYGILRAHLPDSDGAAQVAVSHGRYIANFGSRDGVKPGAIFQAYKKSIYVGLLRVEQVYRDSASLRLVNLELKLDPSEVEPIQRGYLLFPHHVLLETINFGSGKPDFSEEMHERLRYAARFILNFAEFPVIVEGHTDNLGDKEKNRALSQSRAEEVKSYLHDIQQIPRVQMFAVGYADEKPIASNSTDDGRFHNRRVDIVMVNKLPTEVVRQVSGNMASPSN